MAWKKAFEAEDAWVESGFDYIPIEPILKKKGKYRIKKFTAQKTKNPKNMGWNETLSGGEVLYAVYTGVINGPILAEFFTKELDYDKEKIYDVLEKLGINYAENHIRGKAKSHYNLTNFVVEMHEGKPRLYIIDFDLAEIKK